MQLQHSYAVARFAAAVFFFGPGVVYGLFSSRFPYFFAATGAPASAVGLVLLAIGSASLLGLTFASKITAKFGCARVLIAASVFMVAALLFTGFAVTSPVLILGSALIGFGMGLTDYCMNVQGLEVEKQYGRASMNTLHAFYSLGGLSGSLFGSLFAAFGLGPVLNYILPMIPFVGILLWAYPRLLAPSDPSEPKPDAGEKPRRTMPPVLLLGFGFVAMLGFEAEGAVGDWGSLFLMGHREAGEAVAALVYGSVSGTALVSRLAADRIRERIGDFALMMGCSLLAALGMAIVVLIPTWQAALFGFAAAGLGIGPISPALFSIAGRIPGVTTRQASGVMSVFAYCGLLACPPLLGLAVGRWGLESVMAIVLASTALMIAGSFLVRCVGKASAESVGR